MLSKIFKMAHRLVRDGASKNISEGLKASWSHYKSKISFQVVRTATRNGETLSNRAGNIVLSKKTAKTHKEAMALIGDVGSYTIYTMFGRFETAQQNIIRGV